MILLSDTFLANSSEPWQLPDVAPLPEIDPDFATEPNHDEVFMPYLRDEHLARPWAVPGTPGLRHRIGGLEKEDGPATLLRAGEPRAHDAPASGAGRAIAERADLEVDDPRRRRAARARLGIELRRDPGRRPGASGASMACASRPRTSVTSTRCRRTPARAAPVRAGAGARDEHGPARQDPAGRVLVDCESYTKVDGLPFFTRDLIAEILERVG